MVRRASFRLENDAAEELLTSQEARSFVAEVAADAAEVAAQLTPSSDDKDKVVAGGYPDVDGAAAAAFGSRSSIWHILEFGSVNNPPYRPLTRAAERVGLRFKVE